MDWLDQYLDGLGEYKTTVSPADTHLWGVKPKLNNIQERMIFDAAAQSELEFRQMVQEAREELETQGGGAMSVDDVEAGIGADPGSGIVNNTQSFSVNTNNITLDLQGNASVFEFTVGNAVSSFNINIVGFGSFSLLNNYDVNNFNNCYLSAFNFNNFSITFNPVFVTASESLCSNGQLFTIYYTNTGSALFTIFKSNTVEPAPTPTPSVTPSTTPAPAISPTPTVTPTISITPTRTPTPTVTPTVTITPTISITPTRTPTPTVTPTVTITPTISITPTRTPTPTISITPTRTPTPTVTPSSTPPAAFSALLKEDGDALLQENSDYILLEQQ